MTCPGCRAEVPAGQSFCPHCGTLIAVHAPVGYSQSSPNRVLQVLVLLFVLAAIIPASLVWLIVNTDLFSETAAPRRASIAHGRILGPDDFHPAGNLYFVPIGPQDIPVEKLADHYREKFGIQVHVLPAMEIAPEAVDSRRRQLIADELIRSMVNHYRQQADEPDSVLIGLVSRDIYPRSLGWTFTISYRTENRFGVVSSSRMGQRLFFFHNAKEQLAGTLQMLTKYVAILYLKLAENNDPQSILQTRLYPWGGPDDLFESDPHPELTRGGRLGTYPCLAYVFSLRTGKAEPPSGKFPETCSNGDRDPGPDVDVIEFRVAYDTVVEHHTDLADVGLPGVSLRRGYVSSWTHPEAFGTGSSSSFEQQMATQDNMHTLEVIREDGTWVYFYRPDDSSGFSPDAKFAGDASTGMFTGSRVEWQNGVFLLHLRDGSTYTFLPCTNANRCAWDGYQASDGRKLVFNRDHERVLHSIVGPAGTTQFVYNADGEIITVEDGQRTIHYSYAPGRHLKSVEYADHRRLLYSYDAAGRMTSVSSVSANGTATEIIRNQYDGKGRLANQKFADGSEYAYSYPGERNGWNYIEVRRPEGREVLALASKGDDYIWWSYPNRAAGAASSSAAPLLH